MGKDKKEKKNLSGKQPKLSNKEYKAAITKLHAELVKLQYWVKAKGLRIIVLFEGRDGAGKEGFIKPITERVSPRIFRVVALPTPSEREKTQMYLQRYIQHFPAAGEVVIFNRSWYNRAGVEPIMGFCTKKEYIRFLQYLPGFEHFIKDTGIMLIKYWLDTSMEVQEKRFKQRIEDPRKIWKLSPIDIESYKRWYDYSRARDVMFVATDIENSPWYIVPADDKKRARLNCISHFLSLIPYEDLTPKKFELGDRNLDNQYDDTLSTEELHFIPQKY